MTTSQGGPTAIRATIGPGALRALTASSAARR